MGVFSMRRAPSAAQPDAPLSRGTIIGMLLIIGALGYIVTSEVELPPYVLILGGGVVLFAVFLVGLQRPELPLYVLAAYLPFSKQLAGDFGGAAMAFNLTNILLLFLIWSWLVSSTASGHPLFEPHALHVPVCMVACWGLLSFGTAVVEYGSYYLFKYMNDYKRWLDPILLYFLFFHLVRDRQRWKNVVVIIMMSVTVVAAMAVWEYVGISSASSLERSRVFGIADNPNTLGAFFVYYMFLFAGFWLMRYRRLSAWWLLLPFLLCFRGIMVTFSRGAYLAFGAACLGIAFIRNKFLFLVTVGLMVLAMCNPWMLPKGIRYRWDKTFKDETHITQIYGMSDVESEVDASSAERLRIWQGALAMIDEHPVFGVGLGRFPHWIRQYALVDRMYDAHNAYLLMAAEMGLPTLGAFLLVLIAVCWLTCQVYRRHSDPFIRATALGWLGGLAGFVVANMFGSRVNSAEISGYFWIMAALIARAHRWVLDAEVDRG